MGVESVTVDILMCLKDLWWWHWWGWVQTCRNEPRVAVGRAQGWWKPCLQKSAPPTFYFLNILPICSIIMCFLKTLNQTAHFFKWWKRRSCSGVVFPWSVMSLLRAQGPSLRCIQGVRSQKRVKFIANCQTSVYSRQPLVLSVRT